MSQDVSERNVQSDSSKKSLKVTLLGGGWSSVAGGLPTFNRELAIHLSQHPKVSVSFLVPDGHCTDEDKNEAQSFGITVVNAKKRPGWMPLEWLSAPPRGHKMDVVIGHGTKLGRQVPFIKDSDQHLNCKWIQVVHTAPEDLSKYKGYPDPISKGEEKHEVEVALCKLADLVVPVGPRLEECYSAYLQGCKRDIFPIIPGLFDREFGDLEQSPNENAEFKVLLCGRGDDEDFELKGYNVAAEAFTDHRLQRKPYHLLFVGAPERKQEEVRQRLLQCGIANDQLTVRKFVQSREKMKDLLCEVNLVIMPSRSEAFGLVALEALSAGLPILVNSKSGFARALENIPLGKSCILESDEPAKWAEAIEGVRVRHRVRLEEIKVLRASYYKQYNWKEQFESFVEKLWTMVHGSSTGSVKTPTADPRIQGQSDEAAPDRVLSGQQPSSDQEREGSRANVEREPSGVQSLQKDRKRKTSGSTFDLGSSSGSVKIPRADPPVQGQSAVAARDRVLSGQQPSSDQEREGSGTNVEREPSAERKRKTSGSTFDLDRLIRIIISAQDLDEEAEKDMYKLLSYSGQLYVKRRKLPGDVLEKGVEFFEYLTETLKVNLVYVAKSSLEIVVLCSTLESLEKLWNYHVSGHLSKVAERLLVTDEIKTKLNLETVRLTTTIGKENYLMCKNVLMEMAGAAHSTHLPSEETERDQGEDARGTGTSSDDQQGNNTSWMSRAEKAKACRSALHRASINGQYEAVKILLESGADVDKRDQFSLTPLHLACWYGQESIARLLLEYGANANALDRFQRTPLQKAERNNHQSILQLLLENKASPSFQQPFSLKTLAREAFLRVDGLSGYNLLEAAVLSGDYTSVSRASVLLNDFMTEMNFVQRYDASFLSAALGAGSLQMRGYENIAGLHRRMVEVQPTLNELHYCANNDDTEKVIELVLNDGEDINVPAESNRTPLMWASPSSSSTLINSLIDLGADINAQRTHDKVTPLLLAASFNNYMATDLLLQHGADLDAQKINGHTPLLKSVWPGFFNVSHLLLRSGCNANMQDNRGETALHIAVEKNHEYVVKLLLENNADVDKQEDTGETALHKSARGGFFTTSQLLIASGSSTNEQNVNGETPLHLAVENNREACVKLLLDNKADVKKQDRRGNTALQKASLGGFVNMLQLLIEAGCNINQTNADEKTPLYIAVETNEEPVVKLLLDNKADVNIQDNSGDTALHAAAFRGFSSIPRLLIESGCNINQQNGNGESPLHIAVETNIEFVVKLLLENNADVNVQDLEGNTALHRSVRRRFSKIPRLLIESGCNVNQQNGNGESPLHIAVETNSEFVVKLLLENNADVNVQDLEGNTALHRSVRRRFSNISRLLIESGCNVNQQNGNGESPLHIAVETSTEFVVKLLLENNADVNVQDDEGNTALHKSSHEGFLDISELLIESGCNVNLQNRFKETPLSIAAEPNVRGESERYARLLKIGVKSHSVFYDEPDIAKDTKLASETKQSFGPTMEAQHPASSKKPGQESPEEGKIPTGRMPRFRSSRSEVKDWQELESQKYKQKKK